MDKYDEKGNLIYRINETNDIEEWYEYNEKSILFHYKDSNGFEQWCEYDENGNCIHYKDSNGIEYWYEYDENNKCIHIKNSFGGEYWEDYDNHKLTYPSECPVCEEKEDCLLDKWLDELIRYRATGLTPEDINEVSKALKEYNDLINTYLNDTILLLINKNDKFLNKHDGYRITIPGLCDMVAVYAIETTDKSGKTSTKPLNIPSFDSMRVFVNMDEATYFNYIIDSTEERLDLKFETIVNGETIHLDSISDNGFIIKISRNNNKQFGSTVLLYPDIFKNLMNMFECSTLIIIPRDIDNVYCVPIIDDSTITQETISNLEKDLSTIECRYRLSEEIFVYRKENMKIEHVSALFKSEDLN